MPVAVLSRRRTPRYRARRTVWQSPAATVAQHLEALGDDVDRVFLLARPGGTIDGLEAWALGELPAGWEHGRHHLDVRSFVGKYRRPDGRRVEVHLASSWWGEGVDATSAAQAWDALERMVRVEFGAAARLLSTPSTTGRDLWHRTIPEGVAWPALEPEHQELIRASTTQGRWQVWPREGVGRVRGWDMRFGYGALAWGLGVGPARHDHESEWEPYQRGRALVDFTIPRTWSHVGLLPVPNDDGVTWGYPSEPGSRHRAWVDGSELRLALEHGWQVRIRERLLLEAAQPLDTWARKLQRLYYAATPAQLRAYGTQQAAAELAQLVRMGIRAIVITTIGAWHTAQRWEWDVAASIGDLPDDAERLRRMDDGRVIYARPMPTHRAWSAPHPEWSAAIWARCRARILSHDRGARGLLALPPDSLVGVRTDAIYTSADPGWSDTGRIGSLRPSFDTGRPVTLPTNQGELLRLIRHDHRAFA